MVQLIEANWQIFAAVVAVIALLLVIWLIGRATRAKPRERRPDVLDEGAAPAQRNQALIDTPPAAQFTPPPPPITPPPAAGTFAGVGEAIARGAQDEVRAEAEPAGEGDDLRQIKGLGPKLATTLNALGITRFDQIAAMTEADLDELDTKLGAFAGRSRRDNWVEQARFLAVGDTGAYEAKFGKL